MAEMGDTTDSKNKIVPKKEYLGFPIPKAPGKAAILLSNVVDTDQIERIRHAVKHGATWRVAAMQAGMQIDEFEYLWYLGKMRHPVYRDLVKEILRARGDFAAELHEHIAEHALTPAGLKDGTTEKVLKMEEKDSWMEEKGGAPDVVVNIGISKVNLNVDFGEDVEINHGRSRVVDAEVVG